MNARHHTEPESVGLLALIDFKWLMTAEGLAVNVDRLRQDASYAHHIFSAADASGHAVLRRIASELRQRLGACRAWGAESENRPQRADFLPDSPPHSPAMGQEDGEKAAAAVDLQPAAPKSDRLLACAAPGGDASAPAR